MRPVFQWRLRTRSIELGRRTLLMGIVNVTPDSFSDAGEHFHTDLAVEHGLELLRQGADILDIGGESTRPGSRIGDNPAVTVEEELRRVVPVIKSLRREKPDVIISTDTYKSVVAREALAAGAEIINDVSALRFDREMSRVCADLGAGVILMHMRGRPEEWRGLPPLPNPVTTVRRELREWASDAINRRIARDRIVIDPGFGFGKNFDENYPMLAHFSQFQELGYPLLAGTSRKSFIGRTLAGNGKEPVPVNERLLGTLATVAASILAGAHIVRVHDVKEVREVALVSDAILKGK